MKRPEIEYRIETPEQIPAALGWADTMIRKGLQSGRAVFMRLGRERRTILQNRYLWSLCTDLSNQVEWDGRLLIKDDWKDLVTGSWRGQTPVPGIDGGIVYVGGGSSQMSKLQFISLIEFILAFGADQGVEWSGVSREAIEYAKDAKA